MCKQKAGHVEESTSVNGRKPGSTHEAEKCMYKNRNPKKRIMREDVTATAVERFRSTQTK
jgi:hypothetical protein